MAGTGIKQTGRVVYSANRHLWTIPKRGSHVVAADGRHGARKILDCGRCGRRVPVDVDAFAPAIGFGQTLDADRHRAVWITRARHYAVLRRHRAITRFWTGFTSLCGGWLGGVSGYRYVYCIPADGSSIPSLSVPILAQ